MMIILEKSISQNYNINLVHHPHGLASLELQALMSLITLANGVIDTIKWLLLMTDMLV